MFLNIKFPDGKNNYSIFKMKFGNLPTVFLHVLLGSLINYNITQYIHKWFVIYEDVFLR